MNSKRPRIVVFYGGSAHNFDLSSETGQWVCQYIPREKYDVVPVEITPDGKWKVPLGSLPRSGPIGRMMSMLSQAVQALSPTRAIERLLRQPVQGFMTVVRGRGGDDGSLHSLGQALSVPVVGSPYDTCQVTSNKHMFVKTLGDMVDTPYTERFRPRDSVEATVDDIRDRFMLPLFIKPITEEGSFGVEYIESLDELGAAIGKQHDSNLIVQERLPGQELSISLTQDSRGKVYALPPTIIVPQKAMFYDHLAKRRSGRARLHTPQATDNPIMVEAATIARDVYDELGCQGLVTIDMVAGEDLVDVLEVNTVPTMTEMTPLKHQLKAAGLHPATLFDHLLGRALNG